MQKLLSALIAGLFAVASVSAFAAEEKKDAPKADAKKKDEKKDEKKDKK